TGARTPPRPLRAAGCGEPDRRPAPKGPAGEPHRRPLDEATDLREARPEPVLMLEEARLATQEVDEPGEDQEPGEDEGPHAKLEKGAAGAGLGGVHHGFRSGRRPGRRGRPVGRSGGRRRAGPRSRCARRSGSPADRTPPVRTPGRGSPPSPSPSPRPP